MSIRNMTSMLSRNLAATFAPTTAITSTIDGDSAAVTLDSWHGTPGRKEVDSNTGELTSRREFDARDFCGPLDELGTDPAEGMRFVEVINGISYTFECRPASGQPAWDYQDAEKTRVRVHCKRVVS